MRIRHLALVSFVTATACASSSPSVESEGQPIIGGEAERGYPGVGFLSVSKDGGRTVLGPICTASLLRSNVVLTAAHCLSTPLKTDRSWGIVLGEKNAAVTTIGPDLPWYPGAHAYLHPDYVGTDDPRFSPGVDIAVLILDHDVANVRPLEIAQAEPETCNVRHIGYGRVTPDGPNADETGYTYERKSAKVCVKSIDPDGVATTSESSSVCKGDSGGPLVIEGTNKVLGTVSISLFGCYAGSYTYSGDLWKAKPFIDKVLACAAERDPAAACARAGLAEVPRTPVEDAGTP